MKRLQKSTGIVAMIILIAGLMFSGGTQNDSYAAGLPRAPIKTISGFKWGVLDLRLTPDGSILIASDGETVKVFEMPTARLISSFVPHKEKVIALAIAPDGKTLATGGCDQYKSTDMSAGEGYYSCDVAEIKFWDIQTGRLLRTLPGFNGYYIDRGEYWSESQQRNVMDRMYIGGGISDLDFSNDGKVLVSLCLGCGGKTTFWNVETGREIRVFDDPVILSSAFSPDGKTLALNAQGEIQLIDYRTEEILMTLEPPENPVFSPDGKYIAAASGDETIKLWDITKKNPIKIFTGHKDDPFAVAFSPDGKVLATGGYDKVVRLWDVENGGEIGTLPGHRAAVFDTMFTPDGKTLISCGAERYVGGDYLDGTIKFWDASSFSAQPPAKTFTGTSSRELVGHTGEVEMIAISPQGDRLASVSQDAWLKVWDLNSGSELFTVRGDRMGGSYEAVAYSRDGKIIATGAGAVVQLIDAESGRILNVINKGIQSGVTGIAFSPRGRIFTIAAHSLFRTPIYDVESTMKLTELDEGLRDGFSAEAIAFSPDGAKLAMASSTDIKIWDVDSEKILIKWRAHAPAIESISISPDGKLIASAGWDRVVKIWDIETGKLVRSMSGHRGYILSISFSPDGKTIASASNDFTIRIWNVATGKTVKTLTEKYFIQSLAFTPDGSSLAAGVFHSIKIWQL